MFSFEHACQSTVMLNHIQFHVKQQYTVVQQFHTRFLNPTPLQAGITEHPSMFKQLHKWQVSDTTHYGGSRGRSWHQSTHGCADTTNMFIYPVSDFTRTCLCLCSVYTRWTSPTWHSKHTESWVPKWRLLREGAIIALCLWQHMKATFHPRCLPVLFFSWHVYILLHS